MRAIQRPEFIAATLAGHLETCPVCGDDTAQDGDTEFMDSRTAQVDYQCRKCAAVWVGVYRLVGVSVLTFNHDNPTDEMDPWIEFPVADDQRMPEPVTADMIDPDETAATR